MVYCTQGQAISQGVNFPIFNVGRKKNIDYNIDFRMNVYLFFIFFSYFELVDVLFFSKYIYLYVRGRGEQSVRTVIRSPRLRLLKHNVRFTPRAMRIPRDGVVYSV